MDYVSKLENIFLQLKELDNNLSDDLLINKILQTLPDSCKYFVTGWDFLPDDDKKLRTLKNRLIGGDKKETLKKEESVAFFGKETRSCFKCNRAGLIASFGKTKIKNNGSADNEKAGKHENYRPFLICKKISHQENQCFFRDKGASSSPNVSKDRKSIKDEKKLAFMALENIK